MITTLLFIAAWKIAGMYWAPKWAARKGLQLPALPLQSLLFTETTVLALLLLPPPPEAMHRHWRQSLGLFLYYTPAGLLAGGGVIATLTLIFGDMSNWDRLPSAIFATYVCAAVAVIGRCVLKSLANRALRYTVQRRSLKITDADKKVFDELWATTKWPSHFGAKLIYVGCDEYGPDSARLVIERGTTEAIRVEIRRAKHGYTATAINPHGQEVAKVDAPYLKEVVAKAMESAPVVEVLFGARA